MANEKRLISADVAKEMIVNHANEFSDVLNRREKALLIGGGTSCIDKCPTVDAVELPKGKPGDYLEWDNRTGFRQIYCIYAVMICEDCMRYDLEEMTPTVNHKNIVRIMSREEAKAALAKMNGGNEDDNKTGT